MKIFMVFISVVFVLILIITIWMAAISRSRKNVHKLYTKLLQSSKQEPAVVS